MKKEQKIDYINFLEYIKSMSSGKDFIAFQKRIINTKKEILGIKISTLRTLSKNIAFENAEWLFKYDENNIFETILLKGFVIGKITNFDKGTKALTSLIDNIDCWAEVDTVCPNLKFLKDSTKAFEYFSNLLKSNKEFTIRFGVVGIMKYCLKSQDFSKILSVLEPLNQNLYYVDMAIAWLICEYIVNHPGSCYDIMQMIISKYNFSKFIINKSISKSRDSFRLSSTQKESLKSLMLK